MKISEEYEMISNEIVTLRKINSTIKKRKNLPKNISQKDDNFFVPELTAFGTIVMRDFGGVNEAPQKLCGYYVMPRYKENLHQYLKDCKGVHRASTILDVAIQLLGILEVVH